MDDGASVDGIDTYGHHPPINGFSRKWMLGVEVFDMMLFQSDPHNDLHKGVDYTKRR